MALLSISCHLEEAPGRDHRGTGTLSSPLRRDKPPSWWHLHEARQVENFGIRILSGAGVYVYVSAEVGLVGDTTTSFSGGNCVRIGLRGRSVLIFARYHGLPDLSADCIRIKEHRLWSSQNAVRLVWEDFSGLVNF